MSLNYVDFYDELSRDAMLNPSLTVFTSTRTPGARS